MNLQQQQINESLFMENKYENVADSNESLFHTQMTVFNLYFVQRSLTLSVWFLYNLDFIMGIIGLL